MGGKTKKKAAPIAKAPKYAVPNSWDCPLCTAKGAFHVKLDKKNKRGEGQCRACKQPNPAFAVMLTPLTQKVDVFLRFYDELVKRDRQTLAERGLLLGGADERRMHHLRGAGSNKHRDAFLMGDGDDDEEYDGDQGMTAEMLDGDDQP
jgi:transcription elongation factor Elf1